MSRESRTRRNGPRPVQLVNDDFFSTLHARLVEGRSFNETELYGARKMVVVNQTFARKYLGTDNPLGAHVQLTNLEKWPDPVLNPSFEIVGVAADMKNQGLQQPPTPEVWIPYTVTGSWFRGVIIRTSQNPLTMINAVRQQIWATDPAVASTINRTFEDFMNDITYSTATLYARHLVDFCWPRIGLSRDRRVRCHRLYDRAPDP